MENLDVELLERYESSVQDEWLHMITLEFENKIDTKYQSKIMNWLILSINKAIFNNSKLKIEAAVLQKDIVEGKAYVQMLFKDPNCDQEICFKNLIEDIWYKSDYSLDCKLSYHENWYKNMLFKILEKLSD